MIIKKNLKNPIFCIVAMNENRIIGDGKNLLWHLPGDLKRLKKMTMGSPLIMGRKTWDSLPSALPNRRNIVMSRRQLENVEQMDFEEILELKETEICIIGGGEIYRLFLPVTEKIEQTIIHTKVEEPDTWFPEIEGFDLIRETYSEAGTNDDFPMTFRTWARSVSPSI